MDYVNLGRTGLKVSRIRLGMMTYGTSQWRPWILDEADARPIVQRAVELGINFFDTADMYSAGPSEELTGKFLRDFPRRDEVVIASKIAHIEEAVAATQVKLSAEEIQLLGEPYKPQPEQRPEIILTVNTMPGQQPVLSRRRPLLMPGYGSKSSARVRIRFQPSASTALPRWVSTAVIALSFRPAERMRKKPWKHWPSW